MNRSRVLIALCCSAFCSAAFAQGAQEEVSPLAAGLSVSAITAMGTLLGTAASVPAGFAGEAFGGSYALVGVGTYILGVPASAAASASLSTTLFSDGLAPWVTGTLSGGTALLAMAFANLVLFENRTRDAFEPGAFLVAALPALSAGAVAGVTAGLFVWAE